MDHFSIKTAHDNCVKYFEDRVHPTLSSSFPDLRISHHPGTHCARVYFRRKRKHASGIIYDGVSISVPTDRHGNRCQDHDVTYFTPKCIEGILLKNDRLRGMRMKMFSWTSIQEVVDSINNLNTSSNLNVSFFVGIAHSNCVRYFEDHVYPKLTSSFCDLRVAYTRGKHCARVYFGRNRRHSSFVYYDGISVSVPTDRRGNRFKDHNMTYYTPTCIEGVLVINDRLQNFRVKVFSWNTLEDMIDDNNSLNEE